MSHIEKHAPGNFCWVELTTTDQAAAESFYCKIFGWSADNIPMTETEFSTIYQVERRHAAAACALRSEQIQHGFSPHWGVYIAVQNADASATGAAERGGEILAGRFDVGDAGAWPSSRTPLEPHFPFERQA